MKFIALFLVPCLAFAETLGLKPGEKQLEGVQLAVSATFREGEPAQTLQAAGSGLRFKQVLFVKAKVYVAQLFLKRPEALVRTADGALASLEESGAAAIHLTFLREVDAKSLEGAFRDAFKKNGISMESGPVASFLEAVRSGGGAKSGQSLVVAGERSGEKEVVVYEDTEGKASRIEGGAGFLRQVFAIWLGQPADSGLESLKKDILK
jgi:hypothetical protein